VHTGGACIRSTQQPQPWFPPPPPLMQHLWRSVPLRKPPLIRHANARGVAMPQCEPRTKLRLCMRSCWPSTSSVLTPGAAHHPGCSIRAAFVGTGRQRWQGWVRVGVRSVGQEVQGPQSGACVKRDRAKSLTKSNSLRSRQGPHQWDLAGNRQPHTKSNNLRSLPAHEQQNRQQNRHLLPQWTHCTNVVIGSSADRVCIW
jgi:hypothetical protein